MKNDGSTAVAVSAEKGSGTAQQLADIFEKMLNESLAIPERSRSERTWGWIEALEHVVGIARLQSVSERNSHDELVAALRAALDLIKHEYSDPRASALEGHPISRVAREVWDQGWAALSKTGG
jgi:hypothetical protein